MLFEATIKGNNHLKQVLLIISLIFVFCRTGSAQTASNLESLYLLIDRSVEEIFQSEFSTPDSLRLAIVLPGDLKILENRILGSFKNKFGNILLGKSLAGLNVKYSVTNASVVYGEPEKDGLFGNFQTDRVIKYSGSYSIVENGILMKNSDFNLLEEDKIPFNEIQNLENIALPFTKGKVPEEPFFSSILEPIIAVGTTIVTVFLLFSVRSK